jgi:DnaJ domain
MSRSPRRPRAYAPDPDAPGQMCDAPGCPNAGEYRAPKSRTNLRDFHWFCLAHVREYNLAWDYYKGMSPGEIEQQLRADTSWQRPSWPLGRIGQIQAGVDEELRAFEFGPRASRKPPEPQAPAELREALSVLGLAWPVSAADAKARYKELAKRHHPDANGGDRDSEERLKTINQAYSLLKGRLAPRPAAAEAAAR